jgi:hypothetical protein
MFTDNSTISLYSQEKSAQNSIAARFFPLNHRFTIVPYSNIITALLLQDESLDQVAY